MIPARVTDVEVESVPDLRVREDRCRVVRLRERCARYLAGFGTGVSYGVHADNLKNMTRGIVERVLYVRRGGRLARPPQPKVGVFGRLGHIRERLLRKTPSTPVVDRDDFPLLYNGRKRVTYQNAVDSLKTRGLTVQDSYVDTFLKAEKINFTAKVDPAPRVIQPRNPRYNVEVGRYLKCFEKSLFEGFRRVFGYSVVVKGMNAEKQGALFAAHWARYHRPVAFGIDATRFDQHTSKAALEWEHSVYNGAFRSAELARLLKWQLVNRGIARTEQYRLDYTVEGCRMSGDMNTGMGNCLIMSSIMLSYIEDRGIDARLVNNGDDCVVVCESSDLDRFSGLSQWALDFGYQLVREEPVYDLEGIEFCQTRPIYTASGWRMVRDPRVAMSKDCVSLQGWDTEDAMLRWLGSVGACGLSLTRGVPVWEAWYGRLARLGRVDGTGLSERVWDCGMGYLAKDVTPCEIVDEARLSFYRAFGITPDEQVSFEEDYSQPATLAPWQPMTPSHVSAYDRSENPLATWLVNTLTHPSEAG